MELTIEDRLALHELAARYANTIDDRDWDRFDTVFTTECRYELAGFGRLDTVLHGAAAVRDLMVHSPAHPITHHVTNVEVTIDGDVVRMFSKILGPMPGGVIGSADYRDVVELTPLGWRIADRLVSLRRPPRAAASA